PIPQQDFYRFQAFFNAVQADRGATVPYKDKAFAAEAEEHIRRYEAELKNGPEKRELDRFEAELLGKLRAAKARRSEARPYGKPDLRLEMKLAKPRVFTEAERNRYQELLEAANRTQDPEEKAALDAYETPLLERLRTAYSSGKTDPAARFESLTVDDVR